MPFPQDPLAPQGEQATQGQNVMAGGQEGTTPAPAPASFQPAPAVGQQGTSVSAADIPAGAPAPQPQNTLPTVPGQPAAAAPAIPAGSPFGVPPVVQPSAQPGQQPAPTQTWDSARSFALANGFAGANQFQDDATFLQSVINQARSGQATAQQLQQAQQQLAILSAQVANVPVAQPVAPTGPKKHFDAPEFNPAWSQWVQRTENGGYKLVDGCPDPTILPKVVAHENYRRQMAEKLFTNPAEVLGPWVKDLVAESIKPQLEQTVAVQQEQMWADQYMRDNSEWLYARDGQGRVVQDPATGKPVASGVARRFYHHLNTAVQMGIKDFKHQEGFARQAVQNELLVAQRQQAAGPVQTIQAPPPNVPQINYQWRTQPQPQQQFAPQFAPAPQNFAPVNPALRLPPAPLGSTQAHNDPNGFPQNPQVSLNDQLALAFQQAGLLPSM